MSDNKSEGVIIEGDFEAFIEEIESGKALQRWIDLAAGKEKILNRMEEIYRHSWPMPPQINRFEEEMAQFPNNSRWSTFKDKLRSICRNVGWVPPEERRSPHDGI
ncbi:MAG: hypothetical protein U1A25_00540 [Candidatus Sungbacteria bacterium]|nr:hypothetical protein [bacterium]MDZ4260132.1 hypothetical protein [Candidatus Sungbacteria bacterium]